ncbi:MAG TPA: hypothetical protein VE010_23380 [Thermoanaerobaculia bacterium]|nr:hypothetical protein [Thermoanaerobaculia bacterium]
MIRRCATIVLALILVIAATACRQVENGVERVMIGAVEAAQAVALKRGEQQLQAAFVDLQRVAAQPGTATLYHVAHELDPDYHAVAARTDQRVAGYPVRRRVAVTRNQIATLVSVLTRRDTYFAPGDAWSCIFEPHHVLQVSSGRENVLVVICVQCGDVEFVPDGSSIGTRSVLPPANARMQPELDQLLR